MFADRLRGRLGEMRSALAGNGQARKAMAACLARHGQGGKLAALPPFDTPVALAMRAFGPWLEIEMPVGALQSRTHDWVRCGKATYHVGQYFLTEADWPSLVKPLVPSAVMREAAYLRASKLAYRGTLIYARYLEMMEQGYVITRNRALVNTREKLDDYFDRFAALYRSIEENGVLRMRDVRRAAALPGSTAPGSGDGDVRNMDIGVAIGPDGALAVLPGAQHRLAVASVLRLDKVPVQVRMIHGRWLRGLPRDQAASVDGLRQALADLAGRECRPA